MQTFTPMLLNYISEPDLRLLEVEMRIKNRYCVDTSPKLLSVLEEKKIPYEVSTIFDPPNIIFYLDNDDIRKKLRHN